MPRNILLLQGPVGPFFAKFSRQLESRGHNVLKVNLNGGDLYYFRSGKYLNFTSAATVWPAWIESVMLGREIDRIYLFGDCRRYHRQAIGIARRLGIEALLKGMFKHYDHHRSLNVFTEGAYWIQSGCRKLAYRFTERKTSEAILSGNLKYFLLPLQVHSDMQVRQHSEFSSIETYLEHVISSFSKSGRNDCSLVIKHHPYDRGYKNYSSVIKRMALVYGLENRLHYVHDTDLPSLLRNAEGSVLINSTVGISSLYHDTPVKALGEAIYDIDGLTHQGTLETFWKDPGIVDKNLYERFRRYLIDKTQINGSLYTEVRNSDESGLNWPMALAEAS